jgi:hypothetical protein
MQVVSGSRFWFVSAIVLSITCCAPSIWNDTERSELRHFTRSLHENKKADELVVRFAGEAPKWSIGSIAHSDYKKIEGHYKEALRHARNVSDAVLDKLHPELKQHYRKEFQKGVELMRSGMINEQGWLQDQMKGQLLLDQWKDWVQPRRHQLNKRLDEALGSS